MYSWVAEGSNFFFVLVQRLFAACDSISLQEEKFDLCQASVSVMNIIFQYRKHRHGIVGIDMVGKPFVSAGKYLLWICLSHIAHIAVERVRVALNTFEIYLALGVCMVSQYVGPVFYWFAYARFACALNCFGNTYHSATRCYDKQARGCEENQKLSIQDEPTTSV